MVKSPLAAGRDTVAAVAGAVSVALPAIAPAWVTTTEADLSSAGICKSVNVTTRSGAGVVAGAMWNDRWVGAATVLAATICVCAGNGSAA
jgi:hypothetical protein